ncbi:MAG: hypothetical protein ACK4YP_12020 [Myxococcota bacterium]
MNHPPIVLPLPEGVTPDLLATVDGLGAWWSGDATLAGGRAAPGLDGETMAVTRDGDAVTWTGDVLVARFADGALTIEDPTGAVDAGERPEVVLAWEIALATLAWAVGAPRPVRWRRLALPLALAYTDAWGRLQGPEGLAAGTEGDTVRVRIVGARLGARVLLTRAPRAVLLATGGALLRVSFGPGESVNAAFVDVLGDAAALPPEWEAWFARRLGMTWTAQLGDDG